MLSGKLLECVVSLVEAFALLLLVARSHRSKSMGVTRGTGEFVSSCCSLARLRQSLFGVHLARCAVSVSNESLVKANLASGLRLTPGWLNLDAGLNAVAAPASGLPHVRIARSVLTA